MKTEGLVCYLDGMTTGQILQLVAEERIRQSIKHRGKTAGDTIHPDIKMSVLTEEVGEVAEHVCEAHAEGGLTPERAAELKIELIQVAAVAVAWAESLP